jgi:NAD-dependent SIR2 family protein deacetylase
MPESLSSVKFDADRSILPRNDRVDLENRNVTKPFDRAADVLRSADALFITAGAGIGVDSGLPDFRGNEGFWKAYPPMAQLGVSFSEMANPGWFERDPEFAWGFYGHRLNLYRRTTPHRGFTLLLELASSMSGGYFVFTSNVDGQFQKAGFREDSIEECHGSIHHLQCTVPCGSEIWEAINVNVAVDESTFRAKKPLPTCGTCSRLSRPNILMFGDWNWLGTRCENQSRRLSKWLDEVREERRHLVVVECGAGKAVPTVRMRSEQIAQIYSASLIRINPRDFEVPRPEDIGVPCGSAEGIKRICGSL